MKRKNLLIFFCVSIFCILLIITIWLGMEIYQENQITNQKIENPYISEKTKVKQENIIEENTFEEETTNNISQENETKEPISQETKKENKETVMPKQYKGYEVEAKLEIPTIKLETYVIKPYSKQALNVSVTKFWGADANQIGNFCIAGHNFQNNIMFRNLKKLKIGNKIYITDRQNQKLEYTIYNIYTVLPKDVTCLSQNTSGKKEITLITCTLDSQKRIIVKASV